ncbi:MAG: hypothetical protein OEO77_11170 [Acidimicrobiia bacterium]|nr:hypothetical protein [Acidimicrobiia bacterium]
MSRVKAMMTIGVIATIVGACGNADVSTTDAMQPAAATAIDAALRCPHSGEPMATAKLYIEHNATDRDTGVHGLFGGEAWSELCIWDPVGNLILVVDPLNQFDDLKLADLFFESREPENSEVSLDELMAAFPAGVYLAAGTDFEGTPRAGKALFTHDIPTPPTITAPQLAEDEELARGSVIAVGDLVITWDRVTDTLAGNPGAITGYEVIVTNVEHDDPNGWSQPTYDVHVGPDQTSFVVPGAFFEPATVYELEVLALEVSGNQTISAGFFATP